MSAIGPATARLRISSRVPLELPKPAFHQLLSFLTFWSGGRVRVVLDVGDPDCWWEKWLDAVADAPGQLVHLQMPDEAGDDRG